MLVEFYLNETVVFSGRFTCIFFFSKAFYYKARMSLSAQFQYVTGLLKLSLSNKTCAKDLLEVNNAC